MAQGQGADAPAHLNGIARPAVLLDEPIFEPGKSGVVRSFLQGIATESCKLFSQLPGAGHIDVLELPVNDLALAVIGQDQGRVQGLSVPGQSLGFPLIQRGPAYVIPRAGTGEALLELDLPGSFPPCRVIQIQVNPQEICFPAVGEGNAGVIGSQAPGKGVVSAVCRQSAGDQIHAIGVHHGDHMDGVATSSSSLPG